MPRVASVSKDQEVCIRQFVEGADAVGLAIDSTYFIKLMEMLGYKIAPNGARVHADTPLEIQYGAPIKDAWEDQYYIDWQETTDAEVTEDIDTPDPSPSKSTSRW